MAGPPGRGRAYRRGGAGGIDRSGRAGLARALHWAGDATADRPVSVSIRLFVVAAFGALLVAPPVRCSRTAIRRERNGGQVACDGNRLLGLLDRTSLAAPGSPRAGLALTLAPSGAFQGVAHAAGADGRETLLAFTVSFEESTLLRNPERPPALLGRRQPRRPGDRLASGAGAERPLSCRSTRPCCPTRTPPPGSSSTTGRWRPGRRSPGPGAVSTPWSRRATVRCRTTRSRCSGCSRAPCALRGSALRPGRSWRSTPGSGADEVRIDAYRRDREGRSAPFSGRAPRLSARLRVTRDGAGRLLGGTLRVLAACPAGEAGWDCSTAPVGATLGLRPPTFREPAPASGPSAAVTGGGDDQVPIDWTGLLGDSTWRAPLERPAPSLALELAAGPVVVVTAHPDDEVLLAPLLGEVCVELDGRCTLVVATRGERGVCLVPGGCHPDVATVRVGEMRQAAALFGAALVPWDLGDGTATSAAGVRAAWVAAAGGEPALLDRIAGEILAAQDAVGVTDGADGAVHGAHLRSAPRQHRPRRPPGARAARPRRGRPSAPRPAAQGLPARDPRHDRRRRHRHPAPGRDRGTPGDLRRHALHGAQGRAGLAVPARRRSHPPEPVQSGPGREPGDDRVRSTGGCGSRPSPPARSEGGEPAASPTSEPSAAPPALPERACNSRPASP